MISPKREKGKKPDPMKGKREKRQETIPNREGERRVALASTT